MDNKDNVVLQVEGLKKYFPVTKGIMKKQVGTVKAVDNVSFSIRKGETLGMVGESGCGKSTIGKTILRAIDPTEGKILFNLDGGGLEDVSSMSAAKLKQSGFRKATQMIFQDPNSSLDPRMTVLEIISEPLRLNGVTQKDEILTRVEHLMEVVGLDKRYLRRYPHAFSGGQRQRISIARALATNPKFIVADEPTSALDVSIQSQILNLLNDLQEEYDLTYLFISHNLGVVRYLCDRIAVMYLGLMVETASNHDIFEHPMHPYTEALLGSVPIADPKEKSALETAAGEIGNPMNLPKGCRFHPRCPYAKEKCREEEPEFVEVCEGHFSACHFAKELHLKGI